MPVTPQKIGEKVDEVLDSLNARWDLQLPRLHGRHAERAVSSSQLAHRCSAIVRFLCFRDVDLAGLLEDFEERARQIHSQWVFKPSQDKGTLPARPVEESILVRTVLKGKIRAYTPEQRQELVECLEKVLRDDFELARASDSFERSTPPVMDQTAARSAPQPRSSRTSLKSRLTRAHTTPIDTNISKLKRGIDRSDAAGEVWKSPATPNMTKRPPPGSDSAAAKPQKRSRSDPNTSRKCGIKTDFFAPVQSTHPAHQNFDTRPSPTPPDVFAAPENSSSTNSSNTTLVDGDGKDSQEYFPTQEANDFLEDPSVRRSMDSEPCYTRSFSSQDISGAVAATFESYRKQLPSHLPFRCRYELESLSRSWNLDVMTLFKELERLCTKDLLDDDKRWANIKKLAAMHQRGGHETFGPKAWSGSPQPPEKQNRRSRYLMASVKFSGTSSNKLFDLRLHGPIEDKSCRFHRLFGGERFLTLDVPFLQRGNLPKDSRNLHSKADELHREVVKWLSTFPHEIAGRQWRPFWIDDKPKETKDNKYFSRVYLFAISGVGLEETSSINERPITDPLPIEQFFNFHAPFEANLNSADLKYFARMKLGLSKTTPTVVLDQEEFIEIEDTLGSPDSDGKRAVMNDGCALMSLEMAREVSQTLGLNYVPTAIQGRIGGAKGLWIADQWSTRKVTKARNFWIEVSPSQLKIKPHPRRRVVCEELRTFEVSNWSGAPQFSALNTQLLTVLEDRGVPRTVLENCLKAHTQDYMRNLNESMEDGRDLKAWLHKYHRQVRNEDVVPMLGGLPHEKVEKMNMLLDAGSEPLSNPLLHDLLRECVTQYLTRYVEKLKIVVPASTFVYCIADPYGVLEPGEVQLTFSKTWTEPDGVQYSYVSECEGLVARNPANLPSDIQKVKFVHYPKLAALTDTIIFSTKGEQPLASLLSGGDYDGDQVWTCWQQEMTQPFVNEIVPENVTPQSLGLENHSRKLSTIFTRSVAEDIDQFLINCIDFNLKPSLLGTCTNQHEKLVYHQGLKQESSLSLGCLLGYLVDFRKSGDFLSEATWKNLRKELCGQHELSKPAFKLDEKNVPRRSDWKMDNIVDYLRFEVAREEKEKILTQFNSMWPRNWKSDRVLSNVWIETLKRAKYLASDEDGKKMPKTQNDTMVQILQKLREDLEEVVLLWKQISSGSRIELDSGEYPARVNQCFEKFIAIGPKVVEGEDHELNWRFRVEKDRPFSTWKLLRASCFYENFNKGHLKLVWYMAGRELCHMKCESQPEPRPVSGKIYATMTTDSKAVKRRKAAVAVHDDAVEDAIDLQGTMWQQW